jgi:hypothetical protein
LDIQQKALQHMPQDHHREEVMPTYIWCTDCNQLYNKELGCELCDQYSDANQTTIDAMEEAKNT